MLTLNALYNSARRVPPDPHKLIEEEKKNLRHAKFSASGAYRWLACPGSISLADKVSRDTSKKEVNPYAYEGSLAHVVASECLSTPFTLQDFYDSGHIEGDMMKHLSRYVDYCEKLKDKANYLVERTFNLTPLNPKVELFGTADFISWNEEAKELEVVDLKYGKGVGVIAKDNPQLLMYLLGALVSIPLSPQNSITKFTATVIQPRRMDDKPIVQHAHYKLKDLRDFRDRVFAAIDEAMLPKPRFIAGEQCRWCVAASICKEHTQYRQEEAKQIFDMVDEQTEPSSLDIDTLINILDKEKDVIRWIGMVKQHVKDMLLSGVSVPGYELGKGRRKRVWNDPEAVAKFIEGKSIKANVKQLTPASVKKALGELPDELWHWEDGSPTVVKVSTTQVDHAKEIFSNLN